MLLLNIYCIALIMTFRGFFDFLFFISIGYGLSISSISLYLLIFSKNLKYSEIILSLIYIIYGFRLAIFLILREYKSKTYNEKIKSEVDKTHTIGFIPKIFIWLSVALLYICQTSPLTFSVESNEEDGKCTYIGIIILIFGLLLEIIADNQKSNMKKKNPNKLVTSGLYKIVRCPNYLGEIIFWTGSFIFGLNIHKNYFQWVIALYGFIGIIFVIFGGARRIEIRQNSNA